MPRKAAHLISKTGLSSRLWRGSFSWKAALVLALAALVAAEGAVLARSSLPADATIRFTDTGFSPREVSIRQGGSVTFVGDSEFWPASDPHPEHGGYEGFDPGRPLEKGEKWSFVFDKEGTWGFHDHFESLFTGKVKVGRQVEAPKDTEEAIAYCKTARVGDTQCLNDLITRSIVRDGLDEGFALFERFYRTEPEFVEQGCHWAAHAVGEAAYDRYRSGEKVEFTKATAYCGYGFYHGFIEKLLHIDPDLDKVRDLCVGVGESLGKEIPLARLNCFHGIGHGLISDPPPKGQWGDSKAILADAFRVCPQVSEDEIEVGQCYEGAYNGLGSLDPRIIGMSFEDESAVEFCRTEPEESKNYCYYEFMQKVKVPNNSIEAVAPYVKALEPEYQDMTVSTMVAGIVQQRILETDQSYGLSGCRALGGMKEACLKGMVGGYFAHGEPGREYEKALAFCADPEMNAAEKKLCYRHIVISAERMYPRARIDELICPRFEEAYSDACLGG